MLLRRFKIDFDVKMYKDLDPVAAMESQSGAVFFAHGKQPPMRLAEFGNCQQKVPTHGTKTCKLPPTVPSHMLL